jgi:hypothetical protein
MNVGNSTIYRDTGRIIAKGRWRVIQRSIFEQALGYNGMSQKRS